MLKTSLFLSVALITSCSQIQRHIASYGPTPPELTDLLKASEEILVDVQHPDFDRDTCLPYLSALERNIDALNVRDLPREDLRSQAPKIAERSWQIRKALHERLHELGSDCANQIQANFRQFRFIEDYLLEMVNGVSHADPSSIDFQKSPVPMRDLSPNFYSLRTVDGRPVELEDGDVLVTRGISYLSSMIARLGDRGAQFSHIVFVHKDGNELKTIESYVGVGVAFYDMDFALKNENARILWLRARDRGLATKSSQKIGALVKSRIAAKKPIKYDYELNFKDPSAMSCAEVSQVAFGMGSGGQFKIPEHPNQITGARSLIQRLKIPEGETYSPGDMEIDSRFELMGEFRDLRVTRDSRQKDAAMTAMFKWMNEKGYELHDNAKSRMAGSLVYYIRKTPLWPLLRKVGGLDDFSKEIPRNMLKTVTLLNQLGEALQTELKAQDLAFEQKHGMPMTYMDFYRSLEDFRQKDLALYENKQTRKQSKFHKIFRPKRGKGKP